MKKNSSCFCQSHNLLKKRPTGSIDVYIKTPNGKTLRSGAELYKFIEKNDKYWPVFDASVIHFKRNDNQGDTKVIKDLKSFLKEKQNNLPKSDSLIENEVKSKRNLLDAGQKRNKNSQKGVSRNSDEKIKASKSKIGPKSVIKSQKDTSPKVKKNLKSTNPKIGPKSIVWKLTLLINQRRLILALSTSTTRSIFSTQF